LGGLNTACTVLFKCVNFLNTELINDRDKSCH